MKTIFLAIFSVLALSISAGCQQTVTPAAQVQATWTCPACSSTSTYDLSVLYEPNGTATCPPPSTTNIYNEVGTTAAGGLIFTFTPTPGDVVCAIVQNVLSGQTGPASPVSTALTIPPYPGTPTAPNITTTTSSLDKPKLPFPTPSKEMARNQPPSQVQLRLVYQR